MNEHQLLILNTLKQACADPIITKMADERVNQQLMFVHGFVLSLKYINGLHTCRLVESCAVSVEVCLPIHTADAAPGFLDQNSDEKRWLYSANAVETFISSSPNSSSE